MTIKIYSHYYYKHNYFVQKENMSKFEDCLQESLNRQTENLFSFLSEGLLRSLSLRVIMALSPTRVHWTELFRDHFTENLKFRSSRSWKLTRLLRALILIQICLTKVALYKIYRYKYKLYYVFFSFIRETPETFFSPTFGIHLSINCSYVLCTFYHERISFDIIR